MQLFATFLMGLLVFGAGSFVYAADEFGERFSNENPAALEDTRLEDIEPAAGENTDLEDELEEKFNTEVTSTTQDLGDGQVKQHDSVGEGKVRAFYRSEEDSRVMDTEDAAGVEVKILEFE